MLTINIQGARNVRPTLRIMMLIYSCAICRSLTFLIFMHCLKMIANGIYMLRAMPSHLVSAPSHPACLLHPPSSTRFTAIHTLILSPMYDLTIQLILQHIGTVTKTIGYIVVPCSWALQIKGAQQYMTSSFLRISTTVLVSSFCQQTRTITHLRSQSRHWCKLWIASM